MFNAGRLDAYEAAGQHTDDILALLAWTKAERSPPAAASAGGDAIIEACRGRGD